jgi:hypothetical protein
MMPQIESLAARIEMAWGRTRHPEKVFADIATEQLAGPLDLDFEQLAKSLCKGESLPEQRRLDQGFGQPAITLFRGSSFTIEALCWHTSTPAIHEHAFDGAFRILTGSSVHSRYGFFEKMRLGSLSLGKLEIQDVEFLTTGSTRPIPRGSSLIHSNFHLDAPTLTLVVRTDQGKEPERTYLPPGLAYDTAMRTPGLYKRIELLDTMHLTGQPFYLECLRDAVRNSDLYDGMAIVMRAGTRVDDLTFQELVQLLRDRHGTEVEIVIDSLNEERRRCAIVRLRSTVVDPERRFFLACLLSLSSRDPFVKTMSSRYGSTNTARDHISLGVGALLGRDADQQKLFAIASEAILEDVSLEAFPGWAGTRLTHSLSDKESENLRMLYLHVSRHPLLAPLVR